MFRQITIQGLGPHSNTVLDLDPRGTMDITGPSQAGKSMLLTALCWCLYGTDTDGRPLDASLLRDGEVLQVSVTTGKGTTFTRTRTGVTVTPPGLKAVRVTTQAALEPHLKALADAELARLIMVPFAWLPLAHGPGDGRALRGFLARVLPGATADDLLKAELGADEPWTTKAAEMFRRDARKRVDQLTGALAQAKAAPIGAEPVKPDAFKGLEAAALIARRDEVVQANKAVEADQAAWYRESAAHVAAWDAVNGWRRRRSALQVPTQPRVPVTEEMTQAAWDEVAANEAAAAAAAQRRDAIAAHRVKRAEYTAALARVQDWEARAPRPAFGDAPPTPDEVAVNRAAVDAWEAQRRESPPVRPVHPRDWSATAKELPCKGAKACQIAQRSQAEADERNAHHAEVWEAWEAWEASRLPEPTAARELLARAESWRAYEAAKAACGERPTVPADPGPEPEPIHAVLSNAAQEAVEAAKAINAAWTAYEAAAAALGDEPADPAELRPMPVAQPVPEVPQWALDITRDHASYEARAADWRDRAAKRDFEVELLEVELSNATIAADRSETVLELIRTAPGRALAAKLSTLGDLGPVRLDVSDDAITVLVDGRPWRAASTGRRIVADAWLRCALRKAVDMAWLPVVVDEAQSVGGMPIPTPVPGWILRTTASGSLQAVARG